MLATNFNILLNKIPKNGEIPHIKNTLEYIYDFFSKNDNDSSSKKDNDSSNDLEASKLYLMCGLYNGSVLDIFGEVIRKIVEGKGSVKVVLGLDQILPDRPSMEKLIDSVGATNLKIFDSHNNLNNGIFHPKVYILENARKGAFIAGSSNFTGSAFTTNYEFNVALEFDLKKDEDKKTFNLLKSIYLKTFEDYSFEVNEEFIEKLPETVEYVDAEGEKKNNLFEILKSSANSETSEATLEERRTVDAGLTPSSFKIKVIDESNAPVKNAYVEIFMRNSEETVIKKTNDRGIAAIELPENMRVRKILVYAKKLRPAVLNANWDYEQPVVLKKFERENERVLTFPVIFDALEALTKNTRRWVYRDEIINRIFFNDKILYALALRKIRNLRRIRDYRYNIKQIGNFVDFFSSNYTLYLQNPKNNKSKYISKDVVDYIQQACRRWEQSEDQFKRYRRK